MKKIFNIAATLLSTMAIATSCGDSFLEERPTAVVDGAQAMSEPEKMVNAAYAMLGDDWYQYPFNLWPYGDLASDDCLKGGSGTTDTEYHAVEVFSTLQSTMGPLDELWYHLYVAISRCNRALISLEDNGESTLGAQTTLQRQAEVKFLRAHFYFKLLNVYRQVPWIDETVVRDNSVESTPNNAFSYAENYQHVIDDFKFAYDNLPATQAQGGRANKVAAAAYLAKCYLQLAWGDGYEANTGVAHINQDYMKKVLEYTNVVATAAQYGYLEDFGDIFLPEYKNSKESVFAVQHSDYQDDNTTFGRANWGNCLNGVWMMWSCGWDFHKPSQDLVNAYKTENGLPMFDNYNAEDAYPINGVATAQKWDPRLFHTVGMPTFPYKYEEAYTLTTTNSRTPNTYGYYCSMKEVPQRSQGETYNNPWQAFAMNDYVLRYTDVMLMRAEAMIETGDLNGALTIVNAIRQRAKNSVNKHIGYAANQCEIALYSTSDFDSKEKARLRLRWERRLEMAMESSRFFDLRRWGIASTTLNTFYANEQDDIYEGQAYAGYYKDAHFTPGKNEFFPIPYNQLYYIPNLYVQNAGY